MKKFTSIFALGAFLALAPGLAFADTASDASKFITLGFSTINNGLDDFAEEMGIAVPQAAMQQNVYADAFIGKLFPSTMPHFAVGFNLGVTHLNTKGLAQATKALGVSGVEDSYVFPVINADIRLGGVFLPFDVGLAVMKLNSLEFKMNDASLNVDFFTIAIDARYAILEDSGLKPGLSVGAGYSYNSGSFGVSESNADAEVDYKTQTIFVAAQVSKALNIPVVKIGITPFAGLRAVLSKYDNDWSWKLKNESLVTAINAANTLADTSIPTSSSGNQSTSTFGNFQPQFYCGLGINLFVIQITGSVCADLRHLSGDSNLWSGAFSFRVKI